MPTHRRNQFDAWWQERTKGELGERFLVDTRLEDMAWEIWRAAADTYADKYSHIPGENCEEKLTALDKAKDTIFAKMQQHLKGEVERYAREVAIRKEVHRDDYLRSATILAALKQIMMIAEDTTNMDMWQRLKQMERVEKIAREAVVSVWGMSPTKHCDRHSGYRPSCPDCRAVGRSVAREDDGPTESDERGTNSEDQTTSQGNRQQERGPSS